MPTYWKFLRDWHWLARQFREYELVYLDPLVCDVLTTESWQERIIPSAFQTPATPENTFIKHLTEALAGSSRKDLESSLKRGRLGTSPEAERTLQKKVAQVVEQYFPWQRSYMVASLQREKKNARDWADKTSAESLVLVEGMFARRASAPEPLRNSMDAWYPDDENRHRRSVEGVMLEIPVPTTTFSEPFIGLMVDSTAFYQRASIALMRQEWYPFVRVLGLYATNRNGHPFVNVLGILARPHPTLDEILKPNPGERPLHSLPGMLGYSKKFLLDPIPFK